jgi:CheY-like chemotaxis protein
MKIALEQAGQQVHMFSDGPSVLAAIEELEPDVVLLDIGLPGMNGYELAAKLKRQRRLRRAVFIAISGFKPVEQAAQPSGDFDYYFTKPVGVRALLAFLETHSRAGEAETERRRPRESVQLRVLLVEDNADLVSATASLLRLEGLEVKTASTGGEALEAALSFRPQLILCDMNLPDMKGLEVICGLRANPSIRQAFAVILTAMSKSEIQRYNREAKTLGVDEFMTKPITREKIRVLASKLKPRRRTRRK